MLRGLLSDTCVVAGLLLAVRLTVPLPHTVQLPTRPTLAEEALAAVRADYFAGLAELSAAVETYGTAATVAVADDAVTATELDGLRQNHRSARRAYKRVEWLLSHRDEATVKSHINGAPLPTVVQKVPEVIVIEPAGLQPLEELVYEESLDSASAKTLDALADEMAVALRRTVKFQRAERFTHAQVWGAARYGVVRIFTMGVTGFDTPASGESLAEGAVALAGIAAGIAPYYPMLADSLAAPLRTSFAEGQTLLLAADFDAFDRVEFYRKVVAPLYRQLYAAQRALGVETPGEVDAQPTHQNYASRDLFADDFLNDFVFASQPEVDTLFSRKRDLGKRLFHEVKLSRTQTLSCASCHRPELAFTDGETKSIGSDGKAVRRNAPTLVGAVFAERYFADLREPALARQIRHVIQDEHEFDMDYLELVALLEADPSYRRDFAAAYADVDSVYRLSAYSLGDALASYVRTLHSNASPVDRYLRGETDALAPDVRRGMNLFMGKAVCATCHFAPTWSGLVPPYYRESESEVLGVPSVWPLPAGLEASAKTAYLDPDAGRITSGRPQDNAPFYAFSFKTPTVRNAALTAPYMHNGAMKTLAEVVEFYKLGGGAGVGLDVPHQTLPFDNLELDAGEIADLVAFMEALTDKE